MSTHKSLIAKNKLLRSRNVLKRIERIKILEERGRWAKGQSVFGLPMTRTAFKVKKAKKKEEPEAAETKPEGEAAEAEAEKSS